MASNDPAENPVERTAQRVNAQVSDAITQTIVQVVGDAPAQAMGMLYQSMSQSLGLAMFNATVAQQAMQQINVATVSTAVSGILAMAPSIRPAAPDPGGESKGKSE